VLGSGQAREWLQFLLGRQPKDALLYLRKWLKEAARKETIQLKNARSKLIGIVLLSYCSEASRLSHLLSMDARPQLAAYAVQNSSCCFAHAPTNQLNRCM